MRELLCLASTVRAGWGRRLQVMSKKMTVQPVLGLDGFIGGFTTCALEKGSLASVDGRFCLTQHFPPICLSKGHSLLLLSIFLQHINWVWWVKSPWPLWTSSVFAEGAKVCYSLHEPSSSSFSSLGNLGGWGQAWVQGFRKSSGAKKGSVSSRGWRAETVLTSLFLNSRNNCGKGPVLLQ